MRPSREKLHVLCTYPKVDGTVYFFGDDGSLTEFEPEMAPFTTVLGQTDLADTQRILDRLHGGAARICTTRQMEVA